MDRDALLKLAELSAGSGARCVELALKNFEADRIGVALGMRTAAVEWTTLALNLRALAGSATDPQPEAMD